MSHLTSVRTQITDLAAATAALQEMGLEVSGADKVLGGGRSRAVDLLINVPGNHKLGLARTDNGNGPYEVVGDWFYAQHQVGGQAAFMDRLNQLYGVHRAATAAAMQGYLVERETDANGVIRLTLTQP